MTVSAFLDSINWFHSFDRLNEMEEDYMQHMANGLQGKPSSLPMIPTYLSTGVLPAESRNVIVLDAGGTNLRTFLLKISSGLAPEVLYSHKCPVPGRLAPLSREAFFTAIAKEVAPIADKADSIGFCFSFPCVIQPDYDGKILYMDKEVTVHGIEGAMVGEELKKALKALDCACPERIVVLNDTVAALFGSLLGNPVGAFGGFIGMILGTGMNCCYLEENSAITKNEYLRDKPGYSIVNMEAGSYNGRFPLSRADELLATHLADSEANRSEKMVSGAYQGLLFRAMLDLAVEAGVLGGDFAKRLDALEEEICTKDISDFTLYPAHKGLLHDLAATEEELHILWELADALLDRAALVTVLHLTSILRHCESKPDPLYPTAIAIEGTTYEKEDCFRNKVLYYLYVHTEKMGYHFRVFHTQDANMVGAGLAAIFAE